MKFQRFVAALTFVVLSACGGGSTDSQGSSAAANRDDTPEPTGISADDPGCRYIVAGTKPRATNPGGAAQWLNTAVAETFACYDKVTFTFSKDLQAPPPPEAPEPFTCVPSYTVEYREPPFELYTELPSEADPDGKGVSTSTAGFKDANAILYVEMTPAVSVSENSLRPELAYPGNLRLTFPASEMYHINIVEWVKNLPEGEQTPVTTTTVAGAVPLPQRVVWLIGMDEKRPFTTDCASGPAPGLTCPAEDVPCSHLSVLIMR
ncbi:MAG: hypothetical protein FJW86_06985 [Actinobacteria bacterium]|nr:hypothetical protein [Actinomycetota bacterium]